jgi:uncharacterized protein
VLLAVIDTNVWVSALLNPRGLPSRIVDALTRDAFVPAVTERMMRELEKVVRRPKLARRGIQPDEADELLALVNERAIRVAGEPDLAVSRDSNDDMFIAAAVASDADFLVTGDDDLKRDPAVAAFFEGRRTEVLSVRQFLERLDAA